MSNELKVYNQFSEMILHIRLAPADDPTGIYTVDATDEMRVAVANLKGRDFDRMVGKGNELIRFAAKWGSPEYAEVLARYFVTNFGWRTALIETAQPLAANSFATSGSFLSCLGTSPGQLSTGSQYAMVVKIATEEPNQHPFLQMLPAPAFSYQSRSSVPCHT